MSSSPLDDIARHFCVSDIPGATIPSTRLSKVLDSMYHGRPLTVMSQDYLLEQKLNESTKIYQTVKVTLLASIKRAWAASAWRACSSPDAAAMAARCLPHRSSDQRRSSVARPVSFRPRGVISAGVR